MRSIQPESGEQQEGLCTMINALLIMGSSAGSAQARLDLSEGSQYKGKAEACQIVCRACQIVCTNLC